MNIRKRAEELYQKSNGIRREVLRWALQSDDVKAWFEDVLRGGCQNGMIGELIYNSDIEDFFKIHIKEINEIVADFLNNIGSCLNEFDWFDVRDPLIRESNNINYITWLAVEQTAYKIADELGVFE